MNEGCKCLKCYNVYAVFNQAFAYKDTGFPFGWMMKKGTSFCKWLQFVMIFTKAGKIPDAKSNV